MQTVTVYNTDSITARDILAKVSDEDVLTQRMECVGRVYIEQCFFEARQRFDKGLFDLEMRIIGSVKELFIEDYDERQFPCGTKLINFRDAEPVMVNYQLTAEEMGILFSKGVNLPGFEPPANMKFNTMEIPMYIEYKGIYESPVCFARIIRPNEIQTSTKKCGYYGLFELAAEHPDVTKQKENGGIDIRPEFLPELRMEEPVKKVLDQRIMAAGKSLGKGEEKPVDRSVSAVQEIINERINSRPVMEKASDETVRIYNEAVEEYNRLPDEKQQAGNAADLGGDGGSTVPYTVTNMENLYDKLSQKVQQAQDRKAAHGDGSDQFTKEKDMKAAQAAQERREAAVQGNVDSASPDDGDKFLSKSEREKRRSQNIVRQIDVAADNKALNEGNTDIAGHGASDGKEEEKKESAQSLLDGILPDAQGGQQQFL